MSTYSNVGDSNFFSAFGDKSNEDLKQFEIAKEKQIDIDMNKSYDLERELALLMKDEEDDEIKDCRINMDNENSNLSSFSNFIKNNNIFNISAIKWENNNNNNANNKNNPNNLENEEKGNYNISNISNNFPSSSQNFNIQNYENNNNIQNNIFHSSKYSFGSGNDKILDLDKNYINNNLNNNINNNINSNINIINNNFSFNINNNNFGVPKNIYNYHLNNNQSYDFYSNAYKVYNMNNYINFSNNKTFFNNNTNKSFIDNPVYYNNYHKKSCYHPHKKKTFNNKKNNFNQNQNQININNQNNVSGFSKMSNISKNNMSGFSKMSNLSKNNNNRITNNNNDKVISMIKDQNKNKYIQKKIEEKNTAFLHKLYQQMKHNLYEIINDQYGNYVIQKFLDYCDKQILSAILRQLYKYNDKSIYEISINKYGTRALQKLFEKIAGCLKDEDVEIIKAAIKGNVTSMSKNINGNHVIQSIIKNIKNKEVMSFMYKEINQNLIEILKTKPGFCVFTEMTSNFSNEDKNNIYENILKNIDKLINDEFGNFIIQKLLEMHNKNYNLKIFNYIKDKIVYLSSQKYSSKVIESCMADSIIKNKVIRKIIEGNNIKDLILDNFGNYIVQKALFYSKDNEEIFMSIINTIKKNIDLLKNWGELGQKIYNKLIKKYGQYFDNNNNNDDLKK